MAAAALPVANPPRTTLGVTQVGNPTSGLRLPILKVPSAMPSITCRSWWWTY